jgi:hypothetical protein
VPSLKETMTRKEVKKRIREEVRADQARYDDLTRRMREKIEELRRRSQDAEGTRRESS